MPLPPPPPAVEFVHVEANGRPDEAETSTGHHAFQTLVAVRPLVSAVFQRAEEAAILGGLNVGVEHAVIPGALELELAASALANRREAVVAIDLIAKHPFALGRNWELHAGGGGVVQWVLPYEHGPVTEVGIIGTLDLFAWPAERVGVILELNGLALGAPTGFVGEVELALGAAWRF